VAFAVEPGQEQRYDHPAAGGDDCTALGFDETTAAALWDRDPDRSQQAIPVSASVDLEHRWLLAAIRRAAEPDVLYERTLMLAAATLSQRRREPVDARRSCTRRAHRQLVREAREVLALAPQRALPALARELGVSPHHLSRIFHAHTGHTITQHRLSLRCRAALQRIGEGEHDLSRLAADAGFADQSHLTRTLRRQIGRTPSQVRKLLSLNAWPHDGPPGCWPCSDEPTARRSPAG
jgi:AraC-like DNA-binding protein